MAFNFKKFFAGIKIVPKTSTSADSKGDLEVLDGSGKLQYHNGTTVSPVLTESHSATVTNKSIDADSNTIINLENENIKSGAAIDATKIADGSVSNTEFQYINGVTSDVQVQINTIASDLSDVGSDLGAHVVDPIDAHDASAISVVPTGNLASIEVQAALVELQGEADTANTHIAASTDVHGLAGGAAVVGTTSSQTLTNKTITGASIQTPIRLDVKQDTRANLDTYALTAANGQLVFATDEKAMFQVVDTELVPVGGAGVVKITAGENLAINDIVYISSGAGNDSGRTAGRVYKADATVDERVDVIGIATKVATTGNIAEIQVSGLLKGFTGRTAGALYYLSAVTPGAASTTPPSSNTQWIVPVYQATSATEVNINPVAAASAIYISDQENSFTLANNQAAATNVTGLVIDPLTYRGAFIDYTIYRQTDTALSALAQIGQLRLVYNTQSTSFFISDDFSGQNAGITFSISGSGQIQYTSSNIAGANYIGTMKFNIRNQFGV